MGGLFERGRRSPAGLSIALIAALAFACLALLAPGANAAGLVAAYSFDESSGSTVHDLAGSAQDGTLEGDTAWTPEGKYGSALEFDGAGDLVRVADAAALDLTDSFTLEAWVRPDKLEKWSPVFGKDDAGPPSTGYGLFAEVSGGPRGYIAASNGETANAAGTSPLPTEEAWTHLAFTHDGADLRLYVNGQLADTTSTSLAAATTDADLQVGHSSTFSGTYFDGLIDEVRIYDRALGQGEVEHDLETPINPNTQVDRGSNRRNGSFYNANFDRDGIDDYRVDANIADFAFGVWEGGVLDPEEEALAVDFVHRTDCVNPDPFREARGEYELPDTENTTPDPEEPFWVPDPELNERHESSYYGCLENSGEPLYGQFVNFTSKFTQENVAHTNAIGLANPAAGIEGVFSSEFGWTGLGGVAPGARVWSVRVAPIGLNFGAYPASFTYPVEVHGAGFGPVSTPTVPLACATSDFQAPHWVAKALVRGIKVEHDGCTTTDPAEAHAEVRMNTCSYLLRAANADNPYEGILNIECEDQGDEIEIDVYGEGVEQEPTCTETIPPQAGLESFELVNSENEGGKREVEIDGTLQTVEYSISGSCVESPETKSDGELSADATLIASNEKDEPVGIYLFGEEAQNTQGRPRFESEAEWLPQYPVAHLIAGLNWAIAANEDADPANDIDVAEIGTFCRPQGDPLFEGTPLEAWTCDSDLLDEKIREAMDHGIVLVNPAYEWDGDVKHMTPQGSPDALTVSVVGEGDGKPGGEAGCNDDRRFPVSNFGLHADITAAICGDTGASIGVIAGAVAALASQCNPEDRAGAEYIVDTLMAEGDTDEIAEGGWEDTSGDGWKEPLLNLHDEEVFDPVMVDTETGEAEEPPADGCEWKSHQAESDVGSDGRADLVSVGGEGAGASVAAGAFEGPHEEPREQGYEVANAVGSLQGELDPALHDGTGHYAIDTADVDGDRHADLVTAAAGDEGVQVRPGDGEGGFGEAVTSHDGTAFGFESRVDGREPIAVADVDDDGRADLIAHSGASDRILTYPGEEDGTFGAPAESGISVDSALFDREGSYFLDVIDVTGEELDEPQAEPVDYEARHSYADLVAMDTDGTVYVYPGLASGKFGAAVEAAQVDPIMDDGEGVEPIGLGDVDRDRRADLLTLEGGTLKLRTASTSGDGTFGEASVAYEGEVDSSLLDGIGEEPLALLDYTRDGLADLVSVKRDGTVLTYIAQRDRTFAAPVAAEGSLPSIRTSATEHEFTAERPFVRRAGCSAGGCQWPVAPDAPRFAAETYPVSLSGDGLPTITLGGSPATCAQSSLEGELAAQSTSVDLEASYAECTVPSGENVFPVTVETNSCHYTLKMLNQGPPYQGALGVACTEAEDAIEFKTYSGETLVCTSYLGPQPSQGTVALGTIGAGSEREIELNAEVKGLTWSQEGICGAKSGEDGEISGEAELAAFDGEEQQVGAYLAGDEPPPGVYLEGEESEEEAEQPRLAAETYPASLNGDGLPTITLGESEVTCTGSSLEGELAATSASLDLEAAYSGCSTLSGESTYPTDVHMNSCHYGLDVQNAGPPYQGALGIACEEEGDAIELKVYLGEAKEALVCTVEIGPQSGLEGIDLATVGEASERAVEISGQAEGIAWSQSGLCGAKSGEGGTLESPLVLAAG